ncbi:hypothetical protein [uncultured Maribacter sp.]|uniref:hypothetical protein n=1 Tax=uncultured Maribacter sp. TaxID=431308 RepID=UPI00262C8706|nr:hypothetical protein [uncultured Maribacter sp.]
MVKTNYKEVQYHKSIIVIFMSLLILTALLFILKMGSPGKLLTLNSFLFFQFICIMILGLFYKMEIKIIDNILSISFGIGLIQKKINLFNIKEDSIKIKNIPFYYGTGIRFTKHGTLYNTSSGKAVSFTLKENKRFLIGSNNTSELINKLRDF